MLQIRYLHVLSIIITTFIATNAFAKEQLIFAVDLVRHGARAPLYEIPYSPYVWKNGTGELTEEGINQEIQLGKELRNKYVTQNHLLPKIYDPKTIYIRSTEVKRTIISAHSLLLGLYPIKMRDSVNSKIPVDVIPNSEDNILIPKSNENIFSKIYRYYWEYKAWKEKTAHLQKKLEYWNKTTGISLKNFQEIDQLGDNLFIRQLNHVALPKEISDSDAQEIIALGEYGMIHKFKLRSVTYSTGHAFLVMVTNYLEQAIQKKSSLKYVLFSGHDTSILSVMNTLGTPLEKLPEFAARLNFSLYKNGDNYYVKIYYNNKLVNIPKCSGNVCSMSQFIELGE